MKLSRNSKPQFPQLDETTADQVLGTIFETCSVEPNSIPLHVLTSYSNYRRERFSFQRILAAVIMMIFCLLPLLFIAPKVEIQEFRSEIQNLPTYQITVETGFPPVDRISAVIGGANIPVYETGDSVYSVQPIINGELLITVTLANKQYVTERISVTGVDLDPPVLLRHEQEGSRLFLYLSDEISGIDYEKISAVDMDGHSFSPSYYDEAQQLVVFDQVKDSLNIYIPDKSANQLQLVLTVK